MVKRFLAWALLLVTATAVAAGPDDARNAIQAAYDKSIEAFNICFIDGMFACRTRDFHGYGLKGEMVNPVAERQRLGRLLTASLWRHETTHIVSFQPRDANTVVCTIDDTLQFVLASNDQKQLKQVTMQSSSQDVWVQTSAGWRMSSSTLLQQSVKQDPYVDPDAVPASSSPSASPSR